MIIILAILFSVSFCQESLTGSIYSYGSNAREIGLSKTVISNYNIGNNTFTNPALLGFTKNMEYGFSHFPLTLDRYIQSLSIVIPMPDETLSIGLSFFKAGTQKIPHNKSQPDDYKTLGYYSAWEGYGMCSVGAKFSDKLFGGINLKLFRNEIMEYTANGIGTDLGFIYKFSDKNQLGVLFNNLYSKYSWDFDYNGTRRQYDEKFPLIIALGFSSHINKKILSLTQFDYNNSSGYSLVKTAVEINILKSEKIPCMARLGLTVDEELYTGKFKDKKNFELTLGLGLEIPIKNNFKMGIDYAINRPINSSKGTKRLYQHLFSLTFYRKNN